MANFLRYYLKNIILTVVFVVTLAVVGVQNINSTVDMEDIKSSYTRTQFDYFISSPDADQVKSIESDASVDKVFPYYALKNAFPNKSAAKEVFLLLSDDMGDSGISLFTDKTCVEGKYNKSGAMLDNLAAKRLGVGVGDKISFTINGKTFSRTVSALYLTSTYGTLTKGIVLIDFSSDIKAVYSSKAYSAAFITANDTSGVESLLDGYVGEGNVTYTYEDYVEKVCEAKPPYQSQEDYDEECLQKYSKYREDTLASALRSGGQVASKAEAYSLVKGRVDIMKSDIDSLNTWIAVASAILFIMLNAIFIVTNRRNDNIRRDEGMRFIGMAGRYGIITAVTGIVIFAITFGVLYGLAAGTFFAAECLSTVLFFSLPTLIAVPVVVAAAFVYVKLLYANRTRT